jgi:hypothetical protein
MNTEVKPNQRRRKWFQFSLRSVLALMLCVSMLLTATILYPWVVVTLLIVAAGMLVIGLVFLALVAEGAFWDWIGHCLNQENRNSDKKETRVIESESDNKTSDKADD